MGQETTDRVKLGWVAQRPFNFDVRCTGLKPTTTAPVKLYFAGDSSTDGLLALSGTGKEDVMESSMKKGKSKSSGWRFCRYELQSHNSDSYGAKAMILNTMRKLMLFSLTLAASLAWSNAFATCTLIKPSTTMEKTVTMPAKMSLKAAKIGEVMASTTFTLWDQSEGYNCDSYTIHYYNLDTGLELSNYSKVYKTGIPGVGIRFPYGNGNHILPSWSNSGAESNPYTPPYRLIVELIRIDTGVASGTMSANFKVTHVAAGLT